MSAAEYREESKAAYGVVKAVSSLPVSLAPAGVNIYMGVIDGCKV